MTMRRETWGDWRPLEGTACARVMRAVAAYLEDLRAAEERSWGVTARAATASARVRESADEVIEALHVWGAHLDR